ncbi:MAG: hypothetical protein M0R49_03545, partial [Limnochordia bacterium]|nr:hypothetical protein [Limnochordia bacterium]
YIPFAFLVKGSLFAGKHHDLRGVSGQRKGNGTLGELSRYSNGCATNCAIVAHAMCNFKVKTREKPNKSKK